MSQPIDRAFVEIEARGEDEAARDIRKALEDVERDAAAIAKSISAAFESTANKMSDDVNSAVKVMENDIRRVGNEAGSTGAKIGVGISAGAERAEEAIDDLSDSAEDDFGRIRRQGTSLGDNLRNVGQSIVDFFAGISTSGRLASRSLAGLGVAGGPAGLASVLVALTAVSTVLVPILLGLGGALLDVVGAVALLPAAFGSAVSTSVALKLAFFGIDEAVKALASGNLEKIEEALSKLSPSARAFAREINALRGPLGQLQRSVQEAFFKQFTGELTDLVRVSLPTFRTGLSDISDALGNLASEFIKALKSRSTLETFRNIFATTGDIIRDITPSAINLFNALVGAANAGLPFLERFGNAVGEGLDRFANFVTEAIESGKFQQFLEDAFGVIRDLGALAASVGRLVVTIFGGGGDEGRNFIQSLTEAIDKLNEFLQSAEGQENLQSLLDSLKTIGDALVSASETFVTTGRAFTNLRENINNFVNDVVASVSNFFNSIASFGKSAINAIGSFFTSVGQFFVGVGQSIVDAYNRVVAFGSQIITFFQSLPERILVNIQALPGLITGVFTTMFDTVFYLIGFGLGTIIRFFQELPSRIATAIATIVSVVRNVFTTVHTNMVNIVTSIITSVVSFFRQLGPRIQTAISNVVTFIRNVLSVAWSAARLLASDIVNSIVSFFRQLPGRVRDAISNLPGIIAGVLGSIVGTAVRIGEDIIAGVGRGIMAGVGAVVALARRAANRILEGMKDALSIDSPSKKARDEVGKEIGAGVGVGVADSTSDVLRTINEFVRDIIPNASGTSNTTGAPQSIMFSPGAIQVSLVGGSIGVTEARVVGQLVGNEIIGKITRKRVQLQVRTSHGQL